MPLILPSNSISAVGYEVDNSLRFDGADYLVRSKGASETSLTKGTFSFWIKRTNIDGDQHFLYSNTVQDTNNRGYFSWRSTEKIRIISTTNNASELILETNQLFRDPSAWMHIVYSIDTTQSTASNRCILYVNGTRVTSFSTATYMDQNSQCDIFEGGQTNKEYIGGITGGTANLHSYLSEYVYIDGQALDPTSFGEFDSATGIWKPINVSGLTFGTNGFYLDFKNSGSLGADVSGNGNNFTVNNLTSIDQTTDTPTNNFATMNPLDNYYANSTFSEGNLKTVQGSSRYAWNLSTMAVASGKWYAEVKLTTSGDFALIGITDRSPTQSLNDVLGSGTYDYSVYQFNGDVYNNAGTNPPNDDENYAASYASGDIIGIALDCDNNRIYWSKNGQWSNGSGSWNQSSPNGFISITAPASTNNGNYFFAAGDYQSGNSPTFEWNFGNPPFTISSGNSDGNGYGQFEYAPPSGYLALCTKNLATDG